MSELWSRQPGDNRPLVRLPWTAEGERRGRKAEGADAAALSKGHAYLQGIQPGSDMHGRPEQLMRADTAKAQKKKSSGEAVVMIKKKASQWKDFWITGIFSAALLFCGVAPEVVGAVDLLAACFQSICQPTIKRTVRTS